MDLLTLDEKNAYSQVFINIHDTFSRPIIVWKMPDRTIISTTQNYNFLYQEQPDIEQSFVPSSGIFNARIKWNDEAITHDQKDIRENILGNGCRIKVQADAIAYISGSEKIEIDGRAFNLVSANKIGKSNGLFSGDFYTLYLEESL
jgi:hypothetical protein